MQVGLSEIFIRDNTKVISSHNSTNSGFSQRTKVSLAAATAFCSMGALAYLTPSNYIPLLVTGTSTIGIISASAWYFKDACCNAKEEKIDLPFKEEKIEEIKDPEAIEFKEKVDELKIKYDNKVLSKNDKNLMFEIKDLSSEDAEYLFENFINQIEINDSKINAEFLELAYFTYQNRYPDLACRISIKIKPNNLLPSNYREPDKVAAALSYFRIARDATDHLYKRKLIKENKTKYDEWKENIITARTTPKWKWKYEKNPQEILDSVKLEFKKTGNFTEDLFQKIHDILMYLENQCYPEISKTNLIIDEAAPILSNLIQFKSLSCSEDLIISKNLANTLNDLTSNIKNKNQELIVKKAAVAYNQLKMIDKKSALKIAQKFIGLNEKIYKDILDEICSTYVLMVPFAILCAKQADTSEEHKKIAEKIWENTRNSTENRSYYLMGCAKIDNEFCQNKLLDSINNIKNLNCTWIASSCAENLISKDFQIRQGNKAWIFDLFKDLNNASRIEYFTYIVKPTLEAYTRVSKCDSPKQFFSILVKSVELGPNNLFAEGEALEFMSLLVESFKRDGDHEKMKFLLESCEKSKNPQIKEFLKRKSLYLISSKHYRIRSIAERYITN